MLFVWESVETGEKAVMADDEAEQEIRRTLDVVQPVIDVSADRLEGLRTQCATSAEITQQEIRTQEVSHSKSNPRPWCDIWIYLAGEIDKIVLATAGGQSETSSARRS